jgi:hypothetical protein
MISVWQNIIHKLIGEFTCWRRSGPAPSLPTPAYRNEHDSVNMVELGLLKFGNLECVTIVALV